MKITLHSTGIFFLLFLVISCSHGQVATKSKPAVSSDAKEEKMPWRPDMVKITFADGKTKFANDISQTALQIQVRMITNSEEYTISNKGIILASNGNYAKGSKVQSVMVKTALKSIYDKVNQPNFDYGTLGIRFPDGKVQYAWDVTVQPIYFSLIMSHSKFNYQCYFKDGEWKVDNAGGEYRNRTVLMDVFELAGQFKIFY
jgi:hypothetical protein